MTWCISARARAGNANATPPCTRPCLHPPLLALACTRSHRVHLLPLLTEICSRSHTGYPRSALALESPHAPQAATVHVSGGNRTCLRLQPYVSQATLGLHVLRLKRCVQLSDDAVVALAAACRGTLRVLSLNKVPALSDVALQALYLLV